MRVKRIFAALLVGSILLLGGCSFRISSPDSLMHPPGLTGEYEKLQETFEKAVGSSDYTLKSPSTGSNRTAYTLADVDGDGADEAIVFYSSKGDETVKMMLIDVIDGEWKSVCEVKGNGKSVSRLETDDLNGDGISEIVVLWSVYDTSSHNIADIYELQFDEKGVIFNMETLLTQSYNAFELIDADCDGKKEVFIISDDASAPNLSTARLFLMNGNGFDVVGSARVVSGVTEYISVKADSVKSDDGIYKIYVDAVKGDMSCITEILLWDGEKNSLVSAFDGSDYKQNKTYRDGVIASYDIDGDGITEVPVAGRLAGSSYISADGESAGEQEGELYLTQWSKYSDGKFIAQTYSIVNYNDSYMVMFPSEWLSKVTAEINIASHTLYLREWDSSGNTVGDVIIEAVCMPGSQWKNEKQEGYTKLDIASASVYAFKCGPCAKKYGITASNADEFIIKL